MPTWLFYLWILLCGGLVGYLIGFFDGAKIALKLHRRMEEKLGLLPPTAAPSGIEKEKP